MGRLQRVARIGLLTATALAPGVPNARAEPAIVADIASYQGADRAQRLVAGAKREKELTLYSSIPTDDIAVLAAAFDKRYGVKVKAWRADSEGFLQRIVGEARARRFEVDVVAGSSSALEPLYRENLLLEVKSPRLDELIPVAIPPHRQWVAIYLNTIVQAYNTALVRQDTLPKTYRDLLEPQWKGRLGIEAEDFDWFAQVVSRMGEAQGLRLFRELVAGNGVSVRKGDNLLVNLVAAGEVPLALTVYGFQAEQEIEEQQRAASQRRGAVLRFPARGGPADSGRPPVRHREPPDVARPRAGRAHRFRPDARPGQEVAGPLSEDDHRALAVIR
jgi:iron(III) transport system substrate-binding protein